MCSLSGPRGWTYTRCSINTCLMSEGSSQLYDLGTFFVSSVKKKNHFCRQYERMTLRPPLVSVMG